MVGLLIVGIISLLVIVASEQLGEKTGVVAPLMLLVLGVAAGLIPQVPNFVLSPELILEGILPPLLYASAVAMPVMDFRRNLGPISTLSVLLVIATSLALGVLFKTFVPGLGWAGGIALGAIISPTDAVATSIVKSKGVSHRLITVLEGEGLINDASALVILRSAIAATAAGTISLSAVAVDFFWAVSGALLIGWLVGEVAIRVRAKIVSSNADTVMSLTVPFLAALPAEHFGASGLVAAVMAGLVTGHHSAALVPPDHRLTTRQTWSVISLILEGAVFLMMGIQVGALLEDLRADTLGLAQAVAMAAIAIVITLVMRTLLVFPIMRLTRQPKASRRTVKVQKKLSRVDQILSEMADEEEIEQKRALAPLRMRGLRRRVDRAMADLRYYQEARLGYRDGVVMIWSGMRGAVTLAAAQTLPLNTPHRAFLLVTAFLVASMSLILQGGTLGWVIKWVKPSENQPCTRAERQALVRILCDAAEAVPAPAGLAEALGPQDAALLNNARGGAVALATRLFDALNQNQRPRISKEIAEQAIEYAVAITHAQRLALLKVRSAGNLDSQLLTDTMNSLDANQISLELRIHPETH
ncbi:hypothetical protein BSR29_01140 [Boudabousia liubingyangii]|uniref:Cation/H+ exchanger transmembrane domain-containing protein n=1 Tax=Boudabousia liubingyangii TaxID=1921764 RepID=A0A1Q5PQ04_9ACTO|nr:sodium:proton antiporter [Boudabousia liubingyangii]OKL49592.1 hypothetical protein BSR29_01140 [Boudabousia liubingyangii]